MGISRWSINLYKCKSRWNKSFFNFIIFFMDEMEVFLNILVSPSYVGINFFVTKFKHPLQIDNIEMTQILQKISNSFLVVFLHYFSKILTTSIGYIGTLSFFLFLCKMIQPNLSNWNYVTIMEFCWLHRLCFECIHYNYFVW